MKKIDRLTCQEAFRRLDDYLDRELAPDEMLLVRKHLKICEVCNKEYEFEDAVFHAVRRKLQHVPLPDGLRDRVFARIDELREENA